MSKIDEILITGTSRGLGRDLANYYLQAGSRVFGCSRSDSTIDHKCYIHAKGDLTDKTFSVRLVHEVFNEMPNLRCAVLNAGLVASVLPATVISGSFAEDMFQINAIAPTFLASLLSKKFIRFGQGSIVGISSISGPLNLRGTAAYSASKSALESYLRILAREVAPFGVRCNCVSPALFHSSATKKFSDKWLQDMLAYQDIHEEAKLSDLVNVLNFLMSSESRLITGQSIRLGVVG